MFNLKDLKRIIPFKWRIHSHINGKPWVSCVAYIDARDVMDVLDEVVGPENWQCDYKEIKGNLYAGIGIKNENEWVWKWDCGVEPYSEKAKGEASDSFKRAAVKWGVSRFLYELPIQYVRTNEPKTPGNYPYPVDEKGKRIKDLTLYLNNVCFSGDNFSSKKYEKKNNLNISENNLNNVIQNIEKCTSIDELRKIREENILIESNNGRYKKALAKKYEFLSSEKVSLASA